MNKIVEGLKARYGEHVWLREWHNDKCVSVPEEELLKWVDRMIDDPTGITRSGDGCVIKTPSDLIILRNNPKEIYFVNLLSKDRGSYPYDDVNEAYSLFIEKGEENEE